MPRCPHCNYTLVLLEQRRKYKCHKCSRLHSQREIDDKEFVKWNKEERAKEKKEAKKEYKNDYYQKNKDKIKVWQKNYREKNKEKLKESQKRWQEKNPKRLEKYKESQSKYREENREKYNRKKQDYWAKCREHLLEKRRENSIRQNGRIQAQQKLYCENNKILRRINNLRFQQKEFAQRFFEFEIIKPYKDKMDKILPTISLSDLTDIIVNFINYHNSILLQIGWRVSSPLFVSELYAS